MDKKNNSWKKGTGKLGILAPLLGTWQAKTDTPMGKAVCTRTFAPILSGAFIRLVARWEFGPKIYEEDAIYGINDGKISFWSFTSDGKHSNGIISNGSDVDSRAIAFEAEMPGGLARMIYWPNDEESGFNWAVESKTKKGWNRFTQHKYISL
ncbi:MAG TPA: hypothetical protein VKA26_11090 [Ignavibacteriaceae bacterium]|nr:hypothetical protein [Ignavibacteriaceae bacterium]